MAISCRPKSVGFLRRWPCWPGPYSRSLTGLLGRPQRLTPKRRSILCFALRRLPMIYPFSLLAMLLLSRNACSMSRAGPDAIGKARVSREVKGASTHNRPGQCRSRRRSHASRALFGRLLGTPHARRTRGLFLQEGVEGDDLAAISLLHRLFSPAASSPAALQRLSPVPPCRFHARLPSRRPLAGPSSGRSSASTSPSSSAPRTANRS